MHNKDLPKGTLISILKQADIDKSELQTCKTQGHEKASPIRAAAWGINKEYRIVYEVFEEENKIVVLSLKGHYW